MSLVLVLRRAAEDDVREAHSWYESRRVGLGEDFLASVEQGLEQLRFAPTAYTQIHGDIRRVLLKRFPYAVFYVIEPRRIVVLAVLHASRDPARRPRR